MIASSTYLVALCFERSQAYPEELLLKSIAPVHEEVAKLATRKSGSCSSDTSSLMVDDNSIGKRDKL